MEYDKDRYMKKRGDNRTETKSRKGKDFKRRQKKDDDGYMKKEEIKQILRIDT